MSYSLALVNRFVMCQNCTFLILSTSRGLGRNVIPVTTGRLKQVKCIFSPALVQAPLELYTKGNGMVGMMGAEEAGPALGQPRMLTFSLVTMDAAPQQMQKYTCPFCLFV